MDYQAIIDKYYPADDELRRVLLKHSRQVADRCLQIVRKHPELPVPLIDGVAVGNCNSLLLFFLLSDVRILLAGLLQLFKEGGIGE